MIKELNRGAIILLKKAATGEVIKRGNIRHLCFHIKNKLLIIFGVNNMSARQAVYY